MPEEDLLSYAKEHLLEHLLDAGKTLGWIEEMIIKIPLNDPLRSHYAHKYMDLLPAEERDEARKRFESNSAETVKETS